MANVTVTMVDTRMGEAGSYWTAGQSYSATESFARWLVEQGFATATFEEPASDGWEDLRFPASGINPAGAADAPSVETTLTGFPGTFSFSGTLENVIAGIAQMPHAWKRGSDIKPHIHWAKPTGSSSAVSWVFYYRHLNSPGATPGDWVGPVAGTIVKGDQTVSDEHLLTSFGALSMTGKLESTCLNWQVRRLGNTDADNNAVRFYEFDIHYVTNKRGSVYEIPT